MPTTSYRNALLWVFDRLSVDGGLTLGEQKYTMLQVGKVLRGLDSPASRYVPNDWSDSALLTGIGEMKGTGK